MWSQHLSLSLLHDKTGWTTPALITGGERFGAVVLASSSQSKIEYRVKCAVPTAGN